MPISKIYPRVDHITLTVKDFQKSKEFYTKLFVDCLCGEIVLDFEDVFGIRFEGGFMLEISVENPKFENYKYVNKEETTTQPCQPLLVHDVDNCL